MLGFFRLLPVVLPLCCFARSISRNPGPAIADVIYLHGNIYTGIVSRNSNSVLRAQALAVRGDRLAAIGNDAEIEKLKGPQTRVVDLQGSFVMPGFNDAHLHLAEAGLEKLNVDLVGVRDLQEFRERVRAYRVKASPGAWILGGGWDETLWPVKTLPTRKDLDDISGDHPVFLDRADGHLAVANTRALQLAHISKETLDPLGGKIDRDPDGNPTGLLRDAAQAAVRQVIPSPTHEERRRALQLALAELAAHGITSAQDYSPAWENFETYEELEKEGELTARIYEWLPFDEPVEELERKRASHPQSDPMLHTGMLKGFMDGSLGGHTAALLQPYSDDPKNSGLPRYEPDNLNRMAKERVLAGFQLGFHAIGDRGVQMALDAFGIAEQAARQQGVKAPDGSDDFRLRVEHAQVTTAGQILEFKRLNVIASMQPSHVLTDMGWAQDRLGPARAATSYAWASFIRRDVRLAFGSDWPFGPLSPLQGLYAALTRKSEDGKQQYFPEQRLYIDQAIAAYTTGSALAQFAEKEKGRLQPGMLADFVVLDRDITAIAPAQILGSKVLRTVMGGRIVYQAN